MNDKARAKFDQMLGEKPTIAQHLNYLRQRWNDEKEYEDWDDYVKNIRKFFHPYTVTKVTKRPFGVHIQFNGFSIYIFIKVKGNKLFLYYQEI